VRRARILAAAWALALALGWCAARPAAAQEADDRERAKASFRAGANAYAAGDYLAAIQALDAAYELSPLPAIAFSLAQAERKQYGVKREREHLERALKLFRLYLEQEPNGPRKADAQLAIVELSPQLGSASVGESPAKAQARPTRLMIVTDAPGGRIALDGGAPSASPLIREVSPGRHRAHVAASGYYDLDRDVTAVPGELILSEVRLTERPTSLYVWAPSGADIYVDGVYVAQGGPLATIPLATGAHQLTVAQKGRRVVRRDVVLERGHTHTEMVTLEPTAQRFVSQGLFIGGGAALSLGLALSVFAVHSQNDAETFLARQRHKTVSNAERVAYQASIVGRNRYRTGAVISVAGSVGFFITGLFLRELDRPSLPAAPQRPVLAGRENAYNQRRWFFSPLTATGDPGATVELHF